MLWRDVIAWVPKQSRMSPRDTTRAGSGCGCRTIYLFTYCQRVYESNLTESSSMSCWGELFQGLKQSRRTKRYKFTIMQGIFFIKCFYVPPTLIEYDRQGLNRSEQWSTPSNTASDSVQDSFRHESVRILTLRHASKFDTPSREHLRDDLCYLLRSCLIDPNQLGLRTSMK